MVWTGNRGEGTTSPRAYARDHEVAAPGTPAKPVIPGSSDPAFRGDPERWNPEELLVAALAECHMLWFLHLCSTERVVVTGYRDSPVGTMVEDDDGGGRFSEVVLRPEVTLASPEMADKLDAIHDRAHHLCFVANSVNFPVRCEPT